MIRCIVVDDKPLAIDLLAAYIGKVPWLELVHSAQDPLEALEYLRTHPADLIFLDIQMPELNGLQFIRVSGGRVPVILTTAYEDYALDGYAYDVVDYLLKPIPFDRFYQAVEKARARNTAPEAVVAEGSGSIFVKTEYRIQRIALDDIRYIEAKQNYIAIETKTGRVMSLQNIKSIEEKLPSPRFMRVHKSFIVSLEKIDTIERSRIFLGDAVIPIGDSYREALFKVLGS
jgi:two-component system, LytTR family, response regulator